MLKDAILPKTEFIVRRERFFAEMPANSMALFPAAQEVTRSNDTEYPFCQNKNFFYLTGFNEPDALIVLLKNNASDDIEEQQAILFCRAKDPLQEVWHGRRVGPEQAQTLYGFEQCFSLAEIDTLIPSYLQSKQQLMYCRGADSAFEQRIQDWFSLVKAQARQGKRPPKIIFDCASIIHEQRLIKSAAELELMRRVNQISGGAHQRAMEKTSVGKFEYQIEAEILHEFARHGARHPAYASIVAGGDNANILHYTDNSDVLKDNELLLIDAGGELGGYAADITRTFPVNGKFTEPQRAIYQLVLDAQELAIAAIKPNCSFAVLNDLVCELLTKGLLELGILSGDLTELIKDKACKKYFIHGLGHWLGLDVHDVGDYQVNEERQQLRAFAPGMAMTIEPGLYIPLTDTSVDEKWRGIGVRIEDNVVVTEQGYENLTVNAPKSIAEIEAIMSTSK
ncbi:Xaa-Pro aminopeptidase [Colwelliaceae bacterium 6471]